MEEEHVVDLKQAYDDLTPFATPSATPAIDYERGECARTDVPSPPSCIICRHTLLLSYFNCCAVCGNVIEPGRSKRPRDCWYDPSPEAGGLPVRTATTTTTTTTTAQMADGGEENSQSQSQSHCDSPYCKYTHNRWFLAFFALCECMPAAGALMMLALALGGHSWGLLRFGGLMAVQWWQIFVLPRQWHAGQSIVGGQLAACSFMVWFYVEGRQDWHW
ncbi:hypothetical protein F5X99DRAFT_408256 [Biscogniauxia marginata]|nr:hypothetical protein F5X99DRAFT_408256 [Biscogniauxia marginata]